MKIVLASLLVFGVSSSFAAEKTNKSNRKPASGDVQVQLDPETKGTIISFSGNSAETIYKALKGSGGPVNKSGISCDSSSLCITNLFPDGTFHSMQGE